MYRNRIKTVLYRNLTQSCLQFEKNENEIVNILVIRLKIMVLDLLRYVGKI